MHLFHGCAQNNGVDVSIHFKMVAIDKANSTVIVQRVRSSDAWVLCMTSYSPTLRAPIVANVINKPLLFGNSIGFVIVRAVDD